MMQRRKNRSACFDAEEDDRFSLDRLIELSQQFGCAVHAYALMTMRHLGQRYVQQENRGQTPNKLRMMIVRDLDSNVTRRAAREKSKGTYTV